MDALTAIAPRLIVIAAGLALFAWLFDRWISRQEARGRHEGFVSLYVVAGVAVTLIGAAIVVAPLGETALIALAIVLSLFVASGVPMIAGSVSRHADAREYEQRMMSELLDEEE